MKKFKVILCFAGLVIPAVLALIQPSAVSLTDFLKMAGVVAVLPVLFAPVHEFGHFSTAYYYAKKNKYAVKLEMCYKCTKCNNWADYRERELTVILQAGVQLVLLFTVYFAVLSALTGQGLVTLEFFTLAIVSVESNCTVDGVRDTDYYYLRYPDRLVNEDVKSSLVKEIFSAAYVVLLFVVLNVLVLNHLI